MIINIFFLSNSVLHFAKTYAGYEDEIKKVYLYKQLFLSATGKAVSEEMGYEKATQSFILHKVHSNDV